MFPLGIFFGWLFWCHFRLKRVCIDKKTIFVSNYLKEIQVPLVKIENINSGLLSRPRLITVKFINKTLFGSSIVFAPPSGFFDFDHYPIEAEIRDAIGKAKKKRLLKVK
jgi:hypothetical protein